ncbi:MAG: hypothetical protein FWB92_02835 [Oscillospiraceae bacterium]|nr:hypothetical protein [Oscillospiraceae bacterium]
MKKSTTPSMLRGVVALIFVALLALGLSACGRGDDVEHDFTSSPLREAPSLIPDLTVTPTVELPPMTFDEVLVSSPTRFNQGGTAIRISSQYNNYFGEITISGRSYISGMADDVDTSIAVFVTESGEATLTVSFGSDGYQNIVSLRGTRSGNNIQFPFNAHDWAHGPRALARRNIDLTQRIGNITYLRVNWGEARDRTDMLMGLLAVVITQDEAVRFAQDGTLPSALQGLTVTGLEQMFRAPTADSDMPYAGLAFVQAAAGRAHSLAITEDGRLWAWGRNNHGQLGNGSSNSAYSPIVIMYDVIEVAAADDSSFAVRADGSLWAWENNERGLLGDGTTISRHTPVMIMEDVVYISANWTRAIAITSDGYLWEWGINTTSPNIVLDSVVSASAYDRFFMAIRTDGSLWGWGHGRIGDGSGERPHPYPVHVLDDIAHISVSSHILVVQTNGVLVGWGMNQLGQVCREQRDLTGRTITTINYPVVIMDNVISASAVDGSSFALTNEGVLSAWGRVTLNENIENVAQVALGHWHTLIIKENGTLWALGDNGTGQLGDGTTIYRTEPVRVRI